MEEIAWLMTEVQPEMEYKKVSTQVATILGALNGILTQNPESPDFDSALLLRLSFLNRMKEKGWITTDEHQSTLNDILAIARRRFPSDDPLDREDYLDFLNSQTFS